MMAWYILCIMGIHDWHNYQASRSEGTGAKYRRCARCAIREYEPLQEGSPRYIRTGAIGITHDDKRRGDGSF